MPGPHQVVARTEGPTTATWQLHRGTITDLYIKQNRPLKEIMYVMRVNYGLVASVKMYKYRLKAWGIRKNSRASTSTSAAAKRSHKDSSSNASDDSKASSPQTAISTRTPSPALVQAAAPFASYVSFTRSPEGPRVTEHVLQTLDRHFRVLFHPDAYSSSPSSSSMSLPQAPSTSAPLTPPQRRQMIVERQRAMMRAMHENEPGSATTMTLVHQTFRELPNLVKQREHWSIPIALQTPLRLSRIHGADIIARMVISSCRDWSKHYFTEANPIAYVWAQVASGTSSFSATSLNMYGRCVDDHLRLHFGPLHPEYLETHLRLRKHNASPEDFADEVRGLLVAGIPPAEISSILESIFIEELFKECLYIEIRIAVEKEREKQRAKAAAEAQMQQPSMGRQQYLTPAAASRQHQQPQQQQQHRIKPIPCNITAATINSSISYNATDRITTTAPPSSNIVVPIFTDVTQQSQQQQTPPPLMQQQQPQPQQTYLPMSQTEIVDNFVYLINLLQHAAAREETGLTLEEFAYIKAAGGRVVLHRPTAAEMAFPPGTIDPDLRGMQPVYIPDMQSMMDMSSMHYPLITAAAANNANIIVTLPPQQQLVLAPR